MYTANLATLLVLAEVCALTIHITNAPLHNVSTAEAVSVGKTQAQMSMNAGEVQVLMSVKAAVDPEGLVLESWFTPGGTFEGVEWNSQGRVANISLQGRGLSGIIPSSIAELTSLTGLYLHYNNLKGTIPSVLYKLSSLTRLYLNVNHLSGIIPVELGLLNHLQALQLCCNELEGGIPAELGALSQLKVLGLQHNFLMGQIPSSLGYLNALMLLDLSYNQLNGSIPMEIGNLMNLTLLDVSENLLSGSVPSVLRRLQGGFVYNNNSMLCGDGFSFLTECVGTMATHVTPLGGVGPDEPLASVNPPIKSYVPTPTPSKMSVSMVSHSALMSGLVASSVGMLLIGLLIFVLFRRHKQRIGSTFELGTDPSRFSHPFSSELRLFSGSLEQGTMNKVLSKPNVVYSNNMTTHTMAAGSTSSASNRICRTSRSFGSFTGVVFFNGSHQSFQYDLEELEVATNFFSDKNLLGKKGTHSTVYKGVLRDGSCVAVRALHKASCKLGMSEFKEVVGTMAQLRHENIVALKGFCCSSSVKADCFLVYDFVMNGTLQGHLEKKLKKACCGKDMAASGVLDWPTRAKVASSIAKALHFMHRGTEEIVVHQNLSAANVLLDENFNAYLADAGLHRILADDIVYSVLKASAARGYLAPEYVTTGRRQTEKSDVYALGVVLLQLLTGKSNVLGIDHIRNNTSEIDCVHGSEDGDGDGDDTGGESSDYSMVRWARSLIGSGSVEDAVDRRLGGKFSTSAVTHMAAVAFACTHEDPAQRPFTGEVVRLLQKMDACAESAADACLSSGEDYPRHQQALFAERLLHNGR